MRAGLEAMAVRRSAVAEVGAGRPGVADLGEADPEVVVCLDQDVESVRHHWQVVYPSVAWQQREGVVAERRLRR
jgi:hypothetical protein